MNSFVNVDIVLKMPNNDRQEAIKQYVAMMTVIEYGYFIPLLVCATATGGMEKIMKTLAIFLRGINVNGINIKMDELKSVIESMMYKDVKTILATGNIVATTADDKISFEESKNRIEKELSSYFGYEAYIILKSAKQIHEIMEESKEHEVPEGYHHYILLTNENNIAEQLKMKFGTCNKAEKEQLILGEHGIYWIVPKGDTLQSDFGRLCLGKKEFKSILTSRTINTIQKISKYL